jgi:hypothetical protein
MRLFAAYRARRAARAEYWALEARLGNAHRRLATTVDATGRARLLWTLSQVQLDQANVHDAAFGPDLFEPECEEEFALDAVGLYERDAAGSMAQSMRWSATLYRLLAGVEEAVVYTRLGRRERMSAVLGQASDEVLDRMATTPDLGARMTLLDDLYEAVVDKVGGQAAETIACLPYPKRTEAVR